jgi:hypothetical protein
MQPPPIEPESRDPFGSRLAGIVVGYLFWACLFFAVDGLGRRHCQVPARTWVEAGADAHQRALRGFAYDKTLECLEATPWYSYAMAAMTVIALVAPFVVVGLFAKRILHLGLAFPVDNLTATALLYGAVFLAALVLSMGPIWAADWFYDRHGFGPAGPL